MVFDPSELALSITDLQTLASSGALTAPNADEIRRQGSSLAVNTAAATLPASGAYPMAVANYLKLPVGTRINYEAGTSEFAELQLLWNP